VAESCIKFEDLSQIKKKLSFTLPWGEVEAELDKVYDDQKRKVKLKGFRQGKVPRKILETYFKDNAEVSAAANLIEKHYREELDQRKLKPAGYPAIDHKGFSQGENFDFTITVEIEPEFDPQGYVGLELEKADPQVTEEVINKKLEKIRHMYSTLEDVTEDRGLQKGDFTSIEFEGRLDGEEVNELKSDNYFLEIGSGQFLEDFEENMMGMKKGETKNFPFSFPADYHIDTIAGKNVDFTVTLKDHKFRVVPELNEDFVKNFKRFNTLAELREDLVKELAVQMERKSESNLKEDMVNRLLENNDIEVPAAMKENQLEQMTYEAVRHWMGSGFPQERAKAMAESMRDKMAQDAERVVKAGMILRAIAAKENLSITEEEKEAKFRSLAEYYGTEYESLKKHYNTADMMEGMERELLTKKVIDFITEKAIITTVQKELDV
jgi:trigger factor